MKNGAFKELKEKEISGMMDFLRAIMYPHKDDFMKTIKKYIDFSKNEELWRESDHMTGLGMSILEEGRAEGETRGKIEGIVKTYRDFHDTQDGLFDYLKKKLNGVDDQEIRMYIKAYWE